MKSLSILLLPAAATVVTAAYTVDWSTLDGGGGVSAGGSYTVAGTIGQHDTLAMAGGTYAITSGFWSLPELLQVPDGPPLTISTTTGSSLLQWPAASPGWRLETSSNLETWSNVTTPPVPTGDFLQVTHTLPPGDSRRYYKLTFP